MIIMKNLRNLLAATIMAGTLLYSCKPEKIEPTNESLSQSGAVRVPHPTLDTVCQRSDTLFLMREDDRSMVVNKCYAAGNPIPCPPGQPSWGNLVMTEGYYAGVNYVDFVFVLAPSWYSDFNNWRFGIASDFQYNPNGTPIITTDWGTSIIAPPENRWELRFPVSELPSPCFNVAVRVHAIKMNLFGVFIPGSETSLWSQNPNWDVPGHPAQSPSPFLMRFCPDRCLDDAPPQDTTLTGGTCHKCQSSNTVRFNTENPNCVQVTSCKDLSNVVLVDCNGTHYKHDGLSGHSGTFCHPSGLPVTRVYVKSGCFQSGEGPGYGRRFDNPFDVCD
jgi:hypothetical protein